jgi:hypothetical protein
MIVLLLIVHGLLAVALLGALTHQACSVVPPATTSGQRSFFTKFRNVNAAAYARPVVLLFTVTALGGALLYPRYRVDVRPALEDLQLRSANGIFEIKEHLVAVGLGVLPGYWFVWRTPLSPEYAAVRRYLTWLLTFLAWWAFLAGHVLNNIKGLSS